MFNLQYLHFIQFLIDVGQGICVVSSAILATLFLSDMNTQHNNTYINNKGIDPRKRKRRNIVILFIASAVLSVALPFIGKRIDSRINTIEQINRDIEIQKEADLREKRQADDANQHAINLAKAFGEYGLTLKAVYDSTTKDLTYQIEGAIKKQNTSYKSDLLITIENYLEDGKVKPNPVFTLGNHEIIFYFKIDNPSNSVAFTKGYNVDIIQIVNGKPTKYCMYTTGKLNPETIAPGYIAEVKRHLDAFIQRGKTIDSLYITINIKYTDENKTKDKELRKIYLFNITNFDSKLPIVQGEQYDLIENFLEKEHVWDKKN